MKTHHKLANKTIVTVWSIFRDAIQYPIYWVSIKTFVFDISWQIYYIWRVTNLWKENFSNLQMYLNLRSCKLISLCIQDLTHCYYLDLCATSVATRLQKSLWPLIILFKTQIKWSMRLKPYFYCLQQCQWKRYECVN